MRKLRQLPFAGSAAMIGMIALGCSGGADSSDGDGGGMGSLDANAGTGAGNTGAVDSSAGTGAGGSGATGGGGEANGGSGADIGAGGGSSGSAGTNNGGSGGEDIVVPQTGQCQPGVPATSQIPRLTNLQYNAVVADLLNIQTLPDGRLPAAGFEPDSVGELPNTQWTQYQNAAADIAGAFMATPGADQFMCTAGDSACLESAISSFGRKAFRRPMTDAEVARFMTLAEVEPAGTPEEIAEAIVYTFLISPSFLMRTELDAPEVAIPGTDPQMMGYQLSNYEVASRLSFLIWNSIPDDALNAAADAGELQTPEDIRAEAARMIGPDFRDKVSPVIAAAHRFYANIDETAAGSRWGKTEHSSENFPEYSPAQLAPLLAETDAFFQKVGYEGSFQDLFLSDVAFVNEDTAPLYGLNAADYGPELTEVQLDGMERPGFITRGAFLSSYAHQDDTSPILRGVFLLTLMGGQTGTPDPEALKTQLPAADYKTNREAVEALTSVEPSCKGCHWTNINPPGFVLENFSAVGSIQTTDPVYGGEIVTAVESVNFPAGAKPIANAHELMTEIVAGRLTKEIYAQKWVSYATKREKNDFDQCTANVIADNIEGGDYTLANILPDLTQAESFRLRVAAE